MIVQIVQGRRDEGDVDLGTVALADRPHIGEVIEWEAALWLVRGVRFPARAADDEPAPPIVQVEALPLPPGMQSGAPIKLLEAAEA